MASIALRSENSKGTQELGADGTALRSLWHTGDVLIIIFRWG